MSAKDGQDGRDDKAARLAQALRENLKRRKAQARARRGPAGQDHQRPSPGDAMGDAPEAGPEDAERDE